MEGQSDDALFFSGESELTAKKPAGVLPSDGTPRGTTAYKIPAPPSGFVPASAAKLPPHPSALPKPDMKWIPPGQTLYVKDFCISCGMLYYGTRRDSLYGGEPSLINPTKPVRLPQKAAPAAPPASVPASYAQLSAPERREYLAWLASGRDNPAAPVWVPFLFFYGLERRILLDGRRQEAVTEAERTVIRAELERLLACYGQRFPSFRKAAARLVQVIALNTTERLYRLPVPPLIRGADMPFYLRFALSQIASDRVLLPPDFAYLLTSFAGGAQSAVAKRCPEELAALFKARYRERYPMSIRLSLSRRPLPTGRYAPASPVLQTKDLPTGFLHEAAYIPVYRQKLSPFMAECVGELDAYSRIARKYGQGSKPPDAQAYLPPPIWQDDARQAFETFRKELGYGTMLVRAGEFLRRFIPDAPFSKQTFVALMRTLERELIGVAPDILAYPYAVKADDEVVLCRLQYQRLPDKNTSRKSPAYEQAILLLHAVCAVARSGGEATERHASRIAAEINAWEGLDGRQRERLRAYSVLLLKNPPAFVKFARKLAAAPDGTQRAALASAVRVARAAGFSSFETVVFMEKLYQSLKQDVAALYGALHGAADRAPTVGSRETAPALSEQKMERLRDDTAGVSALLSGIFADDAEYIPPPVDAESAGNDGYRAENPLGLDGAHAAFLDAVQARPEWSRVELQRLAGKLGIMLDGAIETINEAAWDALGEPVIEGDGPSYTVAALQP
ncbi:TerB N-terminal domain-containing protein [Treponema endosymbiont of Eucomonympha sp.]|uniref:TerB N-terminal domain-containing protein n=1 Tax=Treponema endosymbiont of Eucomonympha sp. TaxID=1580831 RepID=UPI00078496E3|nr:TerB N-terminal domain-containing protein [Treponema endosymbiont of Eucomonympha sp.]